MRAVIATFLLIVAGACGGSSSPAGPGPATTSLPQFRIIADPVIDMTRGETRALQIEERDAAGAIVTHPASAYAWSSSNAETVSIDTDGTLHARADYGGAAISVRSPAGHTASVHVWVQMPQHVPSAYRLTLVFSENVPQGMRNDFEWAAQLVQEVIRAPLPPFALDTHAQTACRAHAGEPEIPRLIGTETGTIVYVGRSNTGGPSTGGPCVQRPQPRPTTVFGRITVPYGPTTRPGVRLTLHEIGHTLGLVGLYTAGLPGFDRATRRHTGPFTIEGYRRAFGERVPFLEVSTSSHWPFGGDVMSAASPAIRLTTASVGALMDIGYPAAWYGAR